MTDNIKWETHSEDLDDEDLVMEEGGEEEEEEEEYNGKAVYEDFSDHMDKSTSYGRSQREFSRFDMTSNSPIGWNEAIDEKGETIALMMHLEKTIVHKRFFNNFDDDFDQDDLA